MEELDEVQIHPDYSDHKVQIRARLEPELRDRLISFLTQQHDCFAWSHVDMIGIDPGIVVHRLQIDPSYPPVKQKRRKFAPERNRVINEEIQKLIDIGSIRKVQYPDWPANVVVVKKRMASGVFESISPTSTRRAQKIRSRCHTSTCWSTLQPDMSSSNSWMPSPDITRS